MWLRSLLCRRLGRRRSGRLPRWCRALGGDRVTDGVAGSRGFLRLAVLALLLGPLLERCHDDVHAATLEQRLPLDGPVLGQDLGRAHQQVTSEVRVADLAPAEADGDLDAVPLVEELGRASRLRLEVVDVDLDGQPNLLEGLRLLLLLLFALALLELVLVLPVVENAADRRDRGGSDLHEVETLLLCEGERLERGHDAQLLTFIVDDPHLSDPDHLIDAEVLRQLPCSPSTTRPPHRLTDGWPCNVREMPADDTPKSNGWSTRIVVDNDWAQWCSNARFRASDRLWCGRCYPGPGPILGTCRNAAYCR